MNLTQHSKVMKEFTVSKHKNSSSMNDSTITISYCNITFAFKHVYE